MRVPILFLDNEVAAWIRKQEDRFFEEVLEPNAVVFDELKTPFSSQLCIKATSFKPDLLFDTTPIEPEERILDLTKCVVSPSGRFLYCCRRLPRGHHLATRQGRRHGRVYFDDSVLIPILSEVVDSCQPKVWMSLTPAEIFTQRAAVRMASGTVVIGGLGMGWLLRTVCAKKSVENVIVVEQSQELLDWLGPVLRAKYPCLSKVSEWHCGDVIEYANESRGPATDDRCFLLDIWDKYSGSQEDKAFQSMKAQFKRIWGWGS